EVTIHNQLNQIQEKSDKVMSNMQSILNTQGKMLEENAENLQAILINGHEEMEKSNNKTVKAVQEMQKSNVEEWNQINNEISTRKTNIKRNNNHTDKQRKKQQQDEQKSSRDAKSERGGIESDKQRNKHEHDEHKEKSQRNSQKSRARDEGLSL